MEKWLKRIFFGSRKEDYVIYIKFREENIETLRPIPGQLIDDIRGNCIITGNEVIPFHRVEEIRNINGKIIYKRKKQGK
ncbi:MAG: RNA repair domain-containing protein [Desulfurococcaceae archaeon]